MARFLYMGVWTVLDTSRKGPGCPLFGTLQKGGEIGEWRVEFVFDDLTIVIYYNPVQQNTQKLILIVFSEALVQVGQMLKERQRHIQIIDKLADITLRFC
jgi:DNA-dependent RNA polymerase auxiliary subunit epsilon